MGNIKYKESDRVRIKSIDWYNANKDEDGDVSCGEFDFVYPMTKFCGKILTISVDFEDETYLMEEDGDGFVFTREMFEGLVDDGTLIERVDNNGIPFNEWLSYKGAFYVPDNYILKDENGNEILTSKIILEKKKSKYPTNYIECYEVMYGKKSPFHSPQVVKNIGYKGELFTDLQRIIFYRDAYWKIAGEEMGLDKPWEPDWKEKRYIIYRNQDDIIGGYREAGHVEHHIFEFPTLEMRNAFKENFDPDIEKCKEFL